MSQLVQLEGKHTTQTAHRALSVITYIAIIAKLSTLSRTSTLSTFVNLSTLPKLPPLSTLLKVSIVSTVFSRLLARAYTSPKLFFCGRTRKSVKNGNLYLSARYSETKKDIGMANKRSNDGYALCIGDQAPFWQKVAAGQF